MKHYFYTTALDTSHRHVDAFGVEQSHQPHLHTLSTYKRLYPTGVGPKNSMVYTNPQKGHPLGLFYLAGVWFYMGWPRSWLTSSGHCEDIPLISLGTLNILWTRTYPSIGPCHLHNQTSVVTGHTATQQNLHVHTLHHHTAGILSQNTCFLFQGKYYKHIHGAAIGFPISPIVANLFLEQFETKAINTASNSLGVIAYICG